MKRWTTWLGGGLGWALGGPVGALLGAAFGNALTDFWSKDPRGAAVPFAERDFHASLLVLASMVIKADGKVDQRELSFVPTEPMRPSIFLSKWCESSPPSRPSAGRCAAT